ncbi:MAG: MFS transporter [Bacillota bacterium]
MQESTHLYWKRVVGVFFLGWVLMYGNRVVLAPLTTQLGAEWNLTNTQIGLISSGFFLVYTLFQIPAGVLGDILGRRVLLLYGYVLHGVGALCSGLVGGLPAFTGMRLMCGLGQSTYYSTQYAVVSQAVPAERRGFAVAIVNSGMSFGMVVGTWLSSVMVYRFGFGWRAPVIVLGAVTLLLSGIMAAVIKQDTPAQRERQRAPACVTPGLLRIYVSTFCSMYGFYAILTWLPHYLQVERGYTGEVAGVISTVMPLVSVPAGIAAGRMSDTLGRHRLLMLMLPVSALALFLLPATGGTFWLVFALLLYGITGKLTSDPLLVALVADITTQDRYATVFGVLNFAACAATVLAPAITGWASDVTGSFDSGFYLASALSLVALISLSGYREQPKEVLRFGTRAQRG